MDGMPMETLGAWITPLLLLPGVGLLIMSTAARFSQARVESLDSPADPGSRSLLLRRATLFCRALELLYVSVALLTLASLLGGITLEWSELSYWIVTVLTCAGIAGVLAAAAILIRESRLSLTAIRRHLDMDHATPTRSGESRE